MKNSLLFQVFLALALALLVGWATPPSLSLFGLPLIEGYSLLGQLFLRALSCVVVPLVMSSVIIGAARMGAEEGGDRLGLRAIGFFFLTSALAVLVGMAGFFLFSPFLSPNSLALSTSGHLLPPSPSFSALLLRMVPANIVSAASQGEMMGLILFSLLFGLFIPRISSENAALLTSFWKGVSEVMMKITRSLMRALPVGVFGLVAHTVATTGRGSFSSAGLYLLLILTSLFLFLGIGIPLLLLVFSRIRPLAYFRALSPAIAAAFSTSSSAATLPIVMESLEQRLGISERVCRFSLPLGASLAMPGGALFLSTTSLFLARTYGIELSLPLIGMIGFLSLVTSAGIAGVPSASLLSLLLILQNVGIPAEGIGMILAVDRLVDMVRTILNSLGNATCAVLVDNSLSVEEKPALHESASTPGKLSTSTRNEIY